jgi:uncharacterized membrane protein YfcA
MSFGFITFLSSKMLVVILVLAFLTGIFDAGILLRLLGFALGFVVAPILMNALNMKQMVWILHDTYITATSTALLLTAIWKLKQQKINLVRET